jgi:predicted RNase H-like nuclease
MSFVSVSEQRLLPTAGAVLGVDVGFSVKRRSSAICRLEWTDTHVSWTIERFRATTAEVTDAVGHVAGGVELLAAAFDGPLKTGLEDITAYRLAESLLTIRFQPFIGKPGASSAPIGQALHRQTNACAKAVLNHSVAEARHEPAIHAQAIVEAFPSSFLGLMIRDPKALITRRGNRSDVYYQHLAGTGQLAALLNRFLPGRELEAAFHSVTNHDDRAALVCALTALCVAAGEFMAVGDADGWIILPPRDLIADWADWLDPIHVGPAA